MTRLAAWLALALLSAPTPQPLLTRQSIRGGWLGCGRGVLLPQRQLTFQVGDLLFRFGDLPFGVNQLSVALG